MRDKLLKPARNVAHPFNGMAAGAKTQNQKVGQAATIILKSISRRGFILTRYKRQHFEVENYVILFQINSFKYMSYCFDYNLVENCSKCENTSLKTNLHRNSISKNGLHPYCKLCRKKYCDENRNVIGNKQIKNEKNRKKTDVNYPLIENRRLRIYQALKGTAKDNLLQNNLFGIDNDIYKNWIEQQMAPDTDRSIIEIDHLRPICSFDTSKDNKLREQTFNL